MKFGLGLYRHQFDLEHYRFARQSGCTHLALHLTAAPHWRGSLLRERAPSNYPGVVADGPDEFWTYESLARLTEQINSAELQVAAIDHFGPILPPGRRITRLAKKRWLDGVKAIIRNVGGAGIPLLGYDAVPDEVNGRVPGRFARGDAETFGISSARGPVATGVQSSLGRAGVPFRNRLEEYLDELLPVAEDAGVTLVAKVQPPDLYREIIGLHPSAHHALEFRVSDAAGSIGDGVYGALETCLREKRVVSLRLGNVRSGPSYLYESFVDEGELDILRIVRLLKLYGYDGLIVPQDAPRMDCDAPWHAGTAHTLGYLKAALQACDTPGVTLRAAVSGAIPADAPAAAVTARARGGGPLRTQRGASFRARVSFVSRSRAEARPGPSGVTASGKSGNLENFVANTKARVYSRPQTETSLAVPPPSQNLPLRS